MPFSAPRPSGASRPALADVEAARRSRARKRAAGLLPREVWATEDEHRAVRALLASLRRADGAGR